MKSATNADARALVQGSRVGQLLDASVVHDRNAVRHGERLFLVVRDVEEGGSGLLMDASQLGLHLLAQLQVEGAQRLIEQQRARTVHQRAGQRHALPLPTRKLRRSAIGHSLEAHRAQRVSDPLVLVGLRQAA